jgi:RNA polymerase sigma factor (sigma-70 family)
MKKRDCSNATEPINRFIDGDNERGDSFIISNEPNSGRFNKELSNKLDNQNKNNLDPYVFDCAKYYSLRLVKHGFYSFSDLEDLEQEMLVKFIEKSKRHAFDKNKSSPKNWTTILMKSIYSELLRESKIRSKYFSKTSLNEQINPKEDNDNNSEIIDFIEDNRPSVFDKCFKTTRSRKLLEAVESLPEDLRTVCRLLRDKNVAEIARELKLSRKSIYKKIRKIKSMFEEIGLE